MDFAGRLFKQDAETMDITPIGARLEGVRSQLHRGAIIGIRCGKSQARFRVVWVGKGPETGQIGVKQVDVGKYIWGKPLVRELRILQEENPASIPCCSEPPDLAFPESICD
jgi:hypothetical protein